ncbi:hypothetical protein C2869_06335 [Saccharobesus litoralis]|uniref:BD-FAE-like domain-containing protein n=1 Tax=Saccharobesus litoralis TaxID=2172099 RepID=A0A2S0VPD0_9ALTE|nr:alpha/beta hydrolase [Saccharobesus litoralis]AWB66081.1 hypothetical protein C2869_06335 [Saccharobesus litoralis]
MKICQLMPLLFLLVCGITHASTIKDPETQHLLNFTGLKTDILIGEIEGVKLTINIAQPKVRGKKPRPVLVFIHGGGLIKGDKNSLNQRIVKMASKGVVTASLMYRLAPEYKFPAAIEDVKAGIRFIKANAKVLHIDPDNIVVNGASAGGYLAVMLGVTGNSSAFAKHGLYTEYDSVVKAVMAQSPPVGDYTKANYQDFALVKRFKNNSNDMQKSLAAISPVTYLDKQDPPFFISHGTADTVVPVEMSRHFTAELKKLGHEYEYIEVEGGKHSLTRSKPLQAKLVFKATMQFFAKHTRD